MGIVYVGSARSDENKTYNHGEAGDQTGYEVSTQKWYAHSKGWVVLRARDAAKRQLIADAMAAACKNAHIGYDQSQRLTLYNALISGGFSVTRLKKLTKNVECDCSALVRVCILCAGLKDPGNFRTASEPNALLNTGEFDRMIGKSYTDAPDYLCAGDVLVTPVSGHTVVVLTNGDKAGQTPEPIKVVTKPLKSDATMLSMPPEKTIKVVGEFKAGEEAQVFGKSKTNGEWSAVKIGDKKGYIPNTTLGG